MKHLLTGVAMAAALAIAAPAWAQTPAPMTPGGNNPTSGAAGPFAPKPPAAAPMAPAAANPMGARGGKSVKRMMHHTVHHRMNAGDQTTEQLNAQELARITGGGGAPMPAAPMTPGGNNPTSGAAGPFSSVGTAPPPPPK